MIEDPATYPWSNCTNHCGHCPDDILTPHPACTTLGPTSDARAEAYRHLLHETVFDDDLTAIRTYLQQQRVLGKDDFRDMVEAKTRHFAGMRPTHRPPHNKSTPGK
jgi:putative transposase